MKEVHDTETYLELGGMSSVYERVYTMIVDGDREGEGEILGTMTICNTNLGSCLCVNLMLQSGNTKKTRRAHSAGRPWSVFL